MRFKRTGCLWALLALMVFSTGLLAQQTPDSESRLELLTSQPARVLLIRSRSIVTPNGPGGFSRERRTLSDAIIVSEDLENLNRKKKLEDRRQILYQLALCVAGPKVPRSR